MYTKWTCKKCKDIIISNSHRIHEMNTCKCGCSSLDLEEDYARILGDYQFIEDLDYNFYEELLICIEEQGLIEIYLPLTAYTKTNIPFYYRDTTFIRKLEDEMVKQLK